MDKTEQKKKDELNNFIRNAMKRRTDENKKLAVCAAAAMAGAILLTSIH